MGQVLSCETGLISRCRSSSLTRRQHLPWRIGLHGKNLAQSETLCTWRSSLRGTWEVSPVPGLVPDRLGKAEAVRRACKRMRSRSTEEAIEQRKAISGGGRGGKGLARGEQPTGGRGSDTEPSYHGDPIGGCALVRMRLQTACSRRSTRGRSPVR